MSPPNITVSSILSLNLQPDPNPFLALHRALHSEFHNAQITSSIRTSTHFFLGVNGLALIGSAVALGARLWRGERSFYKLDQRPEGTLVFPNAILNYVSSSPLYAFESAEVSASIQSRALSTSERLPVPPIAVNVFFIATLVAAFGGLLGATIQDVKRWNRGATVYKTFNRLLLEAAPSYTPTTQDPAEVISAAIPQAETYVAELTVDFYKFVFPYYVCATFVCFAGIVMAIGCYYQTRRLLQQMSRLQETSNFISGSGSGSNSASASRKSRIDQAATLRKVLRNIIVVSVLICLSMWGYFAVCFIGNLGLARSPIFKMANSSSNRAHSAIFLYIYSLLNCVIVGILLFQTFDPATLSSRYGSSYRKTTHKTPSSPITDSRSRPVSGESKTGLDPNSRDLEGQRASFSVPDEETLETTSGEASF
ncbi:hypothetical protein MNV49_003748 [Pseudohyphozyma bogoriensis]|nr:hypothetical protein MNV49_003748 [Pseudohyphozyma bogoriensis]